LRLTVFHTYNGIYNAVRPNAVFVLAHRGSHSNASLVYICALLQVPYSHRDMRRPKFTFTNVLNLLLLTGCPMFILTNMYATFLDLASDVEISNIYMSSSFSARSLSIVLQLNGTFVVLLYDRVQPKFLDD
jgi:hypothetical protein